MNHYTYMTKYDNLMFYLTHLKNYVNYAQFEAERIEANEKIIELIYRLREICSKIEQEIQKEMG